MWQHSVAQATFVMVLDHFWGVCQRGEVSKPYRKSGGGRKAADEIYYKREDMDNFTAAYMGDRRIGFDDFIKAKSGKDPNLTADMKSMTIEDYGELRMGENKLLDTTRLPVPPGTVLGPGLGHETMAVGPHIYVACTTAMVNRGLPPVVAISTHNV